MSDCEFIVHNYYALATPSSTTSVLDTARALIDDASSSAGWFTPKRATSSSLTHTFGLCYSQQPPFVSTQQKPLNLREWGIAIDAEDDVFSTEGLEEFESTNFELACSATTASLTRKHSQPTEEPAYKRRRLDISPLHHLIPQPHFHLPHFNSHSPPPKAQIPPYTKRTPTLYGPHNPASIHTFLQSDSRSAWVVPVRGSLPWQGSTTASILQPTSSRDGGLSEGTGTDVPSGVAETGEIIWTHAALLSFWTFLLAIRNARTLGPLSLSFHAASHSHSHPHSHSRSPFFSSAPEYSFSNNRQAPVSDLGADGDGLGAHLCRMPLMAVDHIKVYHDAEYAMGVRNILDAWGFEVALRGGVEGNVGKQKGKVRVLKGARLVLVDERSRGVLLS